MLISIPALILAGIGLIILVCMLLFKWPEKRNVKATMIYFVLVLLWGLYSVILCHLRLKVLRTAKRIRWKDYKDEKGKFELDWMKEDESYLKFLWRYEK